KKGQILPLSVTGGDQTAPVLTPALTATQKSLTFKFNGTFDPNNEPNLPFVVTVSSTGGGTKQCAIVETLLGGMRTAEGNDCPQ
ncbi:MAG: hypothetical protein ABI262_01880, partial [Microcoleus sp.]